MRCENSKKRELVSFEGVYEGIEELNPKGIQQLPTELLWTEKYNMLKQTADIKRLLRIKQFESIINNRQE